MRDWWVALKANSFLRAALWIAAGLLAGIYMSGSGSGKIWLASIDDAFKETSDAAKLTEIPLDETVRALPSAEAEQPAAPPAQKPAARAIKKSVPKAAATSTPPESKPQKAAEPAKCAWKTVGIPQGGVIINEIAWAGAEDEPEAEWVELKNVSGNILPLDGWQLQMKGKSWQALHGELAPGALYIVGSAPEDADWQPDLKANLSLSNSGEWLKLFNIWCGVSDEVDARHGWPGGSNSSKKTLERKVAAAGWQTSADTGGTPGKQNTVVLAAPAANGGGSLSAENVPTEDSAPAKILIVEVQTSGGTGLSDKDYVKLWNAGAAAGDISGWKLRRRSKSGTEYSIKTFADGTEVPAEGFYVWANSKYPEGANATSTATLSDDNSIALFSADDIAQDAVAWGNDLVNPYAEGTYPANPLPGQILARKLSGEIYQDTQNNAADFEIK